MNKFVKENFSKILAIFILLQPVLDLVTGLCVNIFKIDITLGIIIRMLFLFYIMFTTIFIYKKKLSFYIYLSIFLYSILYLIGIIIYKDGVVFNELQGLLKALYFPIILISLYDLKDEFRISNMTLFTTLLLYLIFILVPNILGIGFASYEVAKEGSLGFFNAANEISGVISILTPILFITVKDIKNKLLKIIFPILYLIVILTIGTKTPLLTLLITIGMTFLYYGYKCLKRKAYQPIIAAGLVLVVGISSLLLVLPKTTFYKNIKIHLDFLEVDNIIDIFKDKELIDHFIFSQRLTFLKNKANIYSESSLYETLFGIGYTENGKQTKLIEMDYFDILYSHGIIGFILLFSIYGIVLYKIAVNRPKVTYTNFMLKVSVMLIIILSLITGHIITAPAVSIIAIILILNTSKREKKDLLFTSVHLDIGGIETALINLLNRIDYKKYNATVILEEKRGILLERVNKKAKVKELKVSNHSNVIIRKTINLLRKTWFNILYYNNYDFSCCYAPYSYSGNKLSLCASKNNSIYIHSNYKNIYKDSEDIYKFFNTRKVSEFRNIFIVSNESKKAFLEFYKELEPKCKVINNFIDSELIKKKAKEKINISKTKNKLLVFVGRLEDHSKKLTRALNLIKEINKLDLWIIGDGPDRNIYEKYVEENNLSKKVTFLGKKENPYPYMKEADYVILTSDYEGFPVTYLEAIVLEKPIITTIDVSDDQLNIGKDYATIISKKEEEMVKQVNKILEKKPKIKKVNFENIQDIRMKNLERIFDEVI